MAGRLHGDRNEPEETYELKLAPLRLARPTPLKLLRRLVISAIINAIALVPFDLVTDAFSLGGLLITGALISILNAVLWPLLSRVLLPLTVWTLGLAGLVVNAFLVELAILIAPGVETIHIGTALVISLCLAVVNIVVAGVFGTDDDTLVFQRRVARQLRRSGAVQETDVPGVIFLEIDGLAAPIMQRALRDGYLPTLARWMRSHSHRFMQWECDLSSQTSASQAGLLLGTNEGIPAFRWYDRAEKRQVSSSSPKDVRALEERLSTGTGLLADGGASRVNLFSGDADRRMFTLSAIGVAGRDGARDYAAYFAQPLAVLRTFVLAIQDILLELWQSGDQRRRRVWPRIHRHGTYPLLRAFTTVIQRDIAIAAVTQDLLQGTPRVYATFVGYDEVAHHSGVERADALGVLRRLDEQFARLERVRELAPRPFHFVVLSDHGQSQGATFQQKYGFTLQDLVTELADRPVAAEDAHSGEDRQHLTAVFGDVGSGTGQTARMARSVSDRAEQQGEAENGEESIVALASGNLANVYLTERDTRATRADLDDEVPGLLQGLAHHPGVGFVMVQDGDGGALVLGMHGEVRLDDPLLATTPQGADLLRRYGANAPRHLLRTHGFTDVGDMLVMGAYDEVTDEVTAFEQLCGSHGGLGGGQSHPFVFFPASWKEPDEPVVGAGTMHQVFKGWLRDLGQDVK